MELTVWEERTKVISDHSWGLWSRLINKYGPERTLGGVTDKGQYWKEGYVWWKKISDLIEDKSYVIEYGAGAGRVANAAIMDCEKMLLYEPCPDVRMALNDCAQDWAETERVKTWISTKFDAKSWGVPSAIMCINVLNHLSYEEVWEFMARCAKISSQGTRVVVYRRRDWGYNYEVLQYALTKDWPAYHWELGQLKAMFSTHGFKYVESDDEDETYSLDVFMKGYNSES